ncbi:MAG: hypothetical protein AVDCRST_MAG54-3146, partial [uncultured Actinomycetospora sp.]
GGVRGLRQRLPAELRGARGGGGARLRLVRVRHPRAGAGVRALRRARRRPRRRGRRRVLLLGPLRAAGRPGERGAARRRRRPGARARRLL